MHWRVLELGMEFGWLFVGIFSVLIVLGIVHLVTLMGERRGRRREAPLDILKKRYAQGEITKKEYEEMRHDLLND